MASFDPVHLATVVHADLSEKEMVELPRACFLVAATDQSRDWRYPVRDAQGRVSAKCLDACLTTLQTNKAFDTLAKKTLASLEAVFRVAYPHEPCPEALLAAKRRGKRKDAQHDNPEWVETTAETLRQATDDVVSGVGITLDEVRASGSDGPTETEVALRRLEAAGLGLGRRESADAKRERREKRRELEGIAADKERLGAHFREKRRLMTDRRRQVARGPRSRVGTTARSAHRLSLSHRAKNRLVERKTLHLKTLENIRSRNEEFSFMKASVAAPSQSSSSQKDENDDSDADYDPAADDDESLARREREERLGDASLDVQESVVGEVALGTTEETLPEPLAKEAARVAADDAEDLVVATRAADGGDLALSDSQLEKMEETPPAVVVIEKKKETAAETKKNRNAAYRAMLEREKRAFVDGFKRKVDGAEGVDDEASEEELDDGVGRFGDAAPNAGDDGRRARERKLNEQRESYGQLQYDSDDIDAIVDTYSDDEGDGDAADLVRKQDAERDESILAKLADDATYGLRRDDRGGSARARISGLRRQLEEVEEEAESDEEAEMEAREARLRVEAERARESARGAADEEERMAHIDRDEQEASEFMEMAKSHSWNSKKSKRRGRRPSTPSAAEEEDDAAPDSQISCFDDDQSQSMLSLMRTQSMYGSSSQANEGDADANTRRKKRRRENPDTSDCIKRFVGQIAPEEAATTGLHRAATITRGRFVFDSGRPKGSEASAPPIERASAPPPSRTVVKVVRSSGVDGRRRKKLKRTTRVDSVLLGRRV